VVAVAIHLNVVALLPNVVLVAVAVHPCQYFFASLTSSAAFYFIYIIRVILFKNDNYVLNKLRKMVIKD
jgi:hypothetical protein